MTPHQVQLPQGTRPVARAVLVEMLGEPTSTSKGQVLTWGASVELRHMDLFWIDSPRNTPACEAAIIACKLVAR